MSLLITMFPMAMIYATPILIAALGGLFSERCGGNAVGIDCDGTVRESS